MRKSRLPALVATAVAVPVAVVVGFGVFGLLAGAAEEPPDPEDRSPVDVAVPELSDEDAVICLALTATAPEQVGRWPGRPVRGGEHASEFVMAYGDPASIVTCGAEAVDLEETASIYLLNGVCWYTGDDGGEWITVDRSVPVSVSVPEDVEQPADLLGGLSPYISASVPPSADAPSNC